MKKLLKIVYWLFATGSMVLIAAVLYIYAVLVPESYVSRMNFSAS